jgi:hypothetical protein
MQQEAPAKGNGRMTSEKTEGKKARDEETKQNQREKNRSKNE